MTTYLTTRRSAGQDTHHPAHPSLANTARLATVRRGVTGPYNLALPMAPVSTSVLAGRRETGHAQALSLICKDVGFDL